MEEAARKGKAASAYKCLFARDGSGRSDELKRLYFPYTN
jgi:hypothetical protein